jgi:hypothetical protein
VVPAWGRFARGGSAGMAGRIGLARINTLAAITSKGRGPRQCPPQGVSQAGSTGEPLQRKSEHKGKWYMSRKGAIHHSCLG